MLTQARDLPAGTAKVSELQGFGGHHCSCGPDTFHLGPWGSCRGLALLCGKPSSILVSSAVPRARGEAILGGREQPGLEPAQKTEAFPGLTVVSAGRRGNKMVKFLAIPCLSSHKEQRNVGDTAAMPCKHPTEVNLLLTPARRE